MFFGTQAPTWSYLTTRKCQELMLNLCVKLRNHRLLWPSHPGQDHGQVIMCTVGLPHNSILFCNKPCNYHCLQYNRPFHQFQLNCTRNYPTQQGWASYSKCKRVFKVPSQPQEQSSYTRSVNTQQGKSLYCTGNQSEITQLRKLDKASTYVGKLSKKSTNSCKPV